MKFKTIFSTWWRTGISIIIICVYPTKYVHIKSTTVYAPRRNWDSPPTHHPQASVPPPPCFWGEGNTRWRERGWASPNSDEGHTLWYSLYVRTLWFIPNDANAGDPLSALFQDESIKILKIKPGVRYSAFKGAQA
jgi:hypothetical protein